MEPNSILLLVAVYAVAFIPFYIAFGGAGVAPKLATFGLCLGTPVLFLFGIVPGIGAWVLAFVAATMADREKRTDVSPPQPASGQI
ncbi:hypothetical protein PQJ75_00535 [Rhodoplanes sp. TEM]|uniref:YqaE/Pmp3 family membrane protein n=1 Tax=Rhodoplanes tepidamans TaxID=200616 RepID=A0ABT5J518_RHOTP|nr:MULTISPECIES: hypothetical protein [Rhodoplanes]MDC7784738.1 hypothetical protein [Rhodoplanes tepidamans]MDC7982205.1 hypothetical protein [Rhodoplanes sp. TEM]MDQ0356210.1 hypothetical protein [Rhodoplanes tepidamans]